MIEDKFPMRPAQAVFGEDAVLTQNQTSNNPDTIDARADEDETSLVLIADTFSRKPPEDIEETEKVKAQVGEAQNTSDPLASFFR